MAQEFIAWKDMVAPGSAVIWLVMKTLMLYSSEIFCSLRGGGGLVGGASENGGGVLVGGASGKGGGGEGGK